MPRKYHKAQYSKPAIPVHPSLSSIATSTPHGTCNQPPSAATNVNDLLQHLRRSQTRPIAERSHDDTNPHPSVHPSLKAILHVPDTPTPGPRAQNSNGRRQRGPAGPPPPQSWLADSIHAARSVCSNRSGGQAEDSVSPRLDRLPGIPLPNKRTLMHETFKAIAKNWTWHMVYDQHYLPTLQDRHKEILLAYIAVYSSNSMTLASLGFLFQDSSILEDATGSETITHLDLSGSLMGRELSMGFAPQSAPADTDTRTSSSSTTSSQVPDSWDAPLAALAAPSIRFPALTHLSLAHTPKANWRNLLALVPYIGSLTHLSLAYWPSPTLTPNSLLATTSTYSPGSPASTRSVPYSGTDPYSASFGDWSEACSILRRLGRGTLCLKWLDLESCEWLEALTWTDEEKNRPGVDWCGAWRGVEMVCAAQGYVPHMTNNFEDEVEKEEGSAEMRSGGERWDVEEERRHYRERKELDKWQVRELLVRNIENNLARVRRRAGLRPIVFKRTEVEGRLKMWLPDPSQSLAE